MMISANLTLGACGTGGDSESARLITERIRKSQRELQQPEFYFPILKKVLADLIEVSLEGAQGGWDGYAADAISIETFRTAISFVQAIPHTFPAPTVSAEPDGNITFEWYHSKNRVLSVSVSPDGELHYAALLGPNRAYGTEKFFGEVPKIILALVRRVTAA